MKHMILSFKMKGDVISDHILMLWFYDLQRGVQSPKPKSDQKVPNVLMGGDRFRTKS